MLISRTVLGKKAKTTDLDVGIDIAEYHCSDCAANDPLVPWVEISFPENQIPKELLYFFSSLY